MVTEIFSTQQKYYTCGFKVLLDVYGFTFLLKNLNLLA